MADKFKDLDYSKRLEIRSEIDNIAAKDLGNYKTSNERLRLDEFAERFKGKKFDKLLLIAGGGLESLRLISLFGEDAKQIYIVDRDPNSLYRFRVLVKIMEERPEERKEDFEYYLKKTKANEKQGNFYLEILDQMHINEEIESKIIYKESELSYAVNSIISQSEAPKSEKYFFYFSNIIGSGWSLGGESETEFIQKIMHNVGVESAIMFINNNNDASFHTLEKQENNKAIDTKFFDSSKKPESLAIKI